MEKTTDTAARGGRPTEWTQAGFGVWRWFHGSLCYVKHRFRFQPGESQAWDAEVDARRLSTPVVFLHAEGFASEQEARAWCEEWAPLIEQGCASRAAAIPSSAPAAPSCALPGAGAGSAVYARYEAVVDASTRCLNARAALDAWPATAHTKKELDAAIQAAFRQLQSALESLPDFIVGGWACRCGGRYGDEEPYCPSCGTARETALLSASQAAGAEGPR